MSKNIFLKHFSWGSDLYLRLFYAFSTFFITIIYAQVHCKLLDEYSFGDINYEWNIYNYNTFSQAEIDPLSGHEWIVIFNLHDTR